MKPLFRMQAVPAADVPAPQCPLQPDAVPSSAAPPDLVGPALVLLPVVVGLACTLRALLEFAYGGEIYGPGGHPWAVGEWVISYADGFVRRGLSGALLLPIARLTGSPALPYLLAAGGCHLFVAAVVAARYLRHGRTEAVLMLYLPTTVLFPLWDYNVVGRKEQLALVLAGILALSSRNGRIACDRTRDALAFGLAAALMMLMHEALVFFLPLIFALLEVRRPPGSPGGTVKRFLAMVGPSAVVFLLLAALARPVDTAALFAAVPGDGAHMQAWCSARGIGSICWLGFPPSYAVGYVYNIGFDGIVRAFSTVAVTGAIATGLFLRLRGEPVDRRTLALMAAGWAGLLPLHLIAFDWGRWSAAAGMLFVLLAPLPAAMPRRPVAGLLALAAVMSVFTISHMQSQAFEIGGPRLAARIAAALFSSP